MDEPTIKETAQAFADKLAVRVFPFKVTPDASKPGKVIKQPMISAWNRGASRDTSKFSDKLWAEATGYGVMPDGYTVVDIDGVAAQRAFAAGVGREAFTVDTMIVDTPRDNGGVHIWFKGETRHKDGLIPDVDIRSGSTKGWIVGPGSQDPIRGGAWVAREGSYEVATVPPRIRSFIDNPGTASEPMVRQEGVNDSWDTLLGQGRNVALTALKGTLLRHGLTEDAANELIIAANTTLSEPLSRQELEGTVLKDKGDWERGQLELPITPSEVAARWLTVEAVEAMPPPNFLIDPVFPEGTVNVMFGPPGSYKSFIALDWAARLTSGMPLPDYLPNNPPAGIIPRKKHVLYVAAEGVGGLGKRVRASDTIRDSTLLFEPNAWAMNVDARADMLRAAVGDRGIQVIFFDTLRKTAPGADENSVQDMGKLMTLFEEMSTRDGVTVVLVHHSNRGEGRSFRGSSVIEADAYNMWKVTQTSTHLEARISAEKFKDAEPVNMLAALKLNEQAQSLYVSGYAVDDPSRDGAPPMQHVEEVISLLTGGTPRSRLAEYSQLTREELDAGFNWACANRNLRNTGGRANPVWEAD